MKIYKITFCLFFSTVLLFGGGKKAPKVTITYDFSGGRLGDNLIAYMHAKWLSYKYAIPLVYRPFDYAEQFAFSSEEMAMESFAKKYIKVRLINEKQLSVKPKKKTLYVVPYFPESSYENKQDEWKCRYKVDWHDKKFLTLLQHGFKTKTPLRLPKLPENIVTVAMHVRRGGSFETFNEEFPAKVPRDEFYIQALNRLWEVMGGQPLYVYIFTDDQRPELIAEKYASYLDKNIQFDYRKKGNDHNCNVIEDFFTMMQFDCLIRSDSNFSLCLSKIKQFFIEVLPADYFGKENVKILPAFCIKKREKSHTSGKLDKISEEIIPIKYEEKCL